ncbi:histone-lysine N-methyltransferase SETDB1-like isoform X3 [Porites lutea]|uniref:histone-lysine N-methyltransferase SETDB1-like isoform X3 n=1 Tax=Porites lutea TaxID=51062 RepID=UPI003CC50982
MGEIGIMVSRVQQEGFDLEDMIDEELRAAGFLELCERTTRTLLQRAAAVEESHSALRSLLDSIDSQLKEVQGNLTKGATKEGSNSLSGKENGEAPAISKDKQDKPEPKAPVIIIDDDEAEYVDVADMSCQATFEDIASETQASQEKTDKTGDKSRNDNYIPQPQTANTDTLLKHTCTSAAVSTQQSNAIKTVPVSKPPPPTTPKQSDIALHSVSSAGKTPPVIYRTLKSPVTSGAPLLSQRVALKSSPPSLPVQQAVPSVKPSGTSGSTSSLVSPREVRPSSAPSVTSTSKQTSSFSLSTASQPLPSSASKPAPEKEMAPPAGPPKFEIGTRVVGQRSDELWYPGVIEKILPDKNNQQKVKYKVKFDKGARGLLSSNQVSLESNPHPSWLNVGSRVVALRPRDTAEENASWRKPSTGLYGKLDVLYAGIVTENACAENKNRFLVFFDDGFAQYLPVKKLHHVYHTGKKAWDDVAEHSKEFIQEYLEEFPNRPMVKLKVSQWVKTEWRGQWLKAKVMQLDCSLVKMLFQIDNRSEWLYRGSTRLEPLYSALVDGKISTARKKRSRKLTRGASGKPTEPFIDYSITKPCFGISPYSKTDPKGEQQRKLEEKRQQTQLEQQRQLEQQEQMRGENKKMSAILKSSSAISTTSSSSRTSTSTTSTFTGSSTSFTPGSARTSSRQADPLHRSSSDSSLSRLAVSGGGGRSSDGVRSGTPSGTQPSGSFQAGSGKQATSSSLDSSSSTDCTGGQCSAPTAQGRGLVNKCNNPACNGCGTCNGGSMSVFQASTARKKTTAGLGTPKDYFQRHNGIEVIDLEGNGTMLSVPVESDQMINSLASHKNESWEAPWLRTNRRDVRGTGRERIPAFNIPTNSQHKQDAASLIQLRLNQSSLEKGALRDQQCETPNYSVVSSKSAPKGPHKCSNLCNTNQTVEAEESVKHNPRAIPLLLKWKREIAQRHPGNKKTVYYRTPCNKRLRSLPELACYLTITNTANVSIDQFSFDPDVSCQDTVFRDVEPICPDISRGAERVEISVVNEVDTCFPPPIDYVSRRILHEGVNMVLDPAFLACCDCTDNCQDKSKCSCAQLTIQASAAVGGKEDPTIGYEFRKLKEGVQTGIYECNQNCACGTQCFNRVVQNGIQLRLQVFKTENRGWGLRCLDDIPMGTFVCTYAGQILNEDMANKEGRDFGDEYLAELDHIEVVEKAKEGYESNVSDLEEDDSVIYQTLGGESSSTISGSDKSGESSSENDSSEADSLLSDESFSSGRNSRQGDSENNTQRTSRRKKRKRSSGKSEKKRRGVQGEESLMVERESKAHCLSNLADEKWCYIALKRNRDNQKEAAAFLKKMMKGEVTAKIAVDNVKNTEEKPEERIIKDIGKLKQDKDEEEKNVSQSSEFDFDEVDESFCQKMRDNTAEDRTVDEGLNMPSLTKQGDETEKQSSNKDTEDNGVNIIDLTSDVELESEGCSTKQDSDLQSGSEKQQNPQLKLEPDSEKTQSHTQADEKVEKSVHKVEALNTDTAPPLISVEDLSKLAAQNPTVADEPPVLIKMNVPSRRVSNSLEDMISRLKTRVLTTQPPSSDSSLNGGDEQLLGDVLDKRSSDKSPESTENTFGVTVEPISDASSPETENLESCPASPASLRSDVSKTESLDRKSEISTASSRRSGGTSSKPPAKKFKSNNPKIHYSRSQPKPTSTSPSIKASPNTPSPSRPSLSRQSSSSSKRMSTRSMFGEEHCYVIDAKAYGNCGRYLNHSCSPNLFVQNVFVDTHDLRFPWVAFFTQQNVPAGTELTWDYAYEVDSVKGKVLHCYCGSAECRGRLL